MLEEVLRHAQLAGHKLSLEIPELKEGEIIISHVGDGEYEYNVFGSAWTSWKDFLAGLEKSCPTQDQFFALNVISLKTYSEKYMIFYRNRQVAEISVEKLNPTNGVIFQ